MKKQVKESQIVRAKERHNKGVEQVKESHNVVKERGV